VFGKKTSKKISITREKKDVRVYQRIIEKRVY